MKMLKGARAIAAIINVESNEKDSRVNLNSIFLAIISPITEKVIVHQLRERNGEAFSKQLNFKQVITSLVLSQNEQTFLIHS